MRLDLKSPLFSHPIAHRGLWQGLIENSMTAYEKAVSQGFPIEIDLYSSTDDVLYCFHDITLERMTGEKGFITDKSSAELDSLRLLDNSGEKSNQQIPKFIDVLRLAQNKVPLLIEIKNQPDKDIVKKVLRDLDGFKGEFAIQSFNPLYINEVKKLAPNIIRGILATNDYEDLKTEKFIIRLIIKNMLLNFLIKPDFISYKFTGFPLKKRKVKNKSVLAWTVTSQEIFDKVKPYVNNVIFEDFTPKF